jgi:dimeric dUTPase (all-alpha-NTP-PPase superfamily)
MAPQTEVLQLIRDDLKDIKDNQKEMRTELTTKFGVIHKRIDELVKERSKCEIQCIQRVGELEKKSNEKTNSLEKQIFKTSGLMAGAISAVLRFGEWVVSVIIK